MNEKPITPYKRLKDQFKEAWDSVEFRHTVPMHCYPNAKKGGSFDLTDLAYKVDAAKQLGYDVMLVNKEDELHVQYVKKVPARPFVLTYY